MAAKPGVDVAKLVPRWLVCFGLRKSVPGIVTTHSLSMVSAAQVNPPWEGFCAVVLDHKRLSRSTVMATKTKIILSKSTCMCSLSHVLVTVLVMTIGVTQKAFLPAKKRYFRRIQNSHFHPIYSRGTQYRGASIFLDLAPGSLWVSDVCEKT